MLNNGVNTVLDSRALLEPQDGREDGVFPGLVGAQELNCASVERERLVQYPVEIPALVLSPQKDPET